MLTISQATDAKEWDRFLCAQQYRPFLQSWTMGEVYRRIGQEPVRLIAKDGDSVVGICFAHVVPARRGRHLSIPYGPVIDMRNGKYILEDLFKELRRIAQEHRCSFIRMSPFWPASTENDALLRSLGARPSPLHLLAEHLWYLPLVEPDPWSAHLGSEPVRKTEETIFSSFRATTRNLIRRAQKEGVTVEASADPVKDLPHFLALHDETRKRHGFTPYTSVFFRAQVEEFAKTDSILLYLARYQNEVIAASIHMRFGGEVSYHHGSSTHRFSKIPASYLLQWTAITDALRSGAHVYNFWGIAPGTMDDGKWTVTNGRHPFAGVTLFKTGFGGNLLELPHCRDVPLSPRYAVTRMFETVRKWRRGF